MKLEVKNKKMVVEIRCKLYSKHMQKIKGDHRIKGAIVKEEEGIYINGSATERKWAPNSPKGSTLKQAILRKGHQRKKAGDQEKVTLTYESMLFQENRTSTLASYHQKLRIQWKDFRWLCKSMYPAFKLQPLWSKIFAYRRAEFPDLCNLAEVVLCIGPSNATVEAGFSHLTAMLSDRRLLLSHSTMRDLLLLNVNHLSLSKAEREQITTKAVESFLTRRKRKHQLEDQQDSKKQRLSEEDENCDEGEREEEMDVEDDEEGEDQEDFSDVVDEDTQLDD
ncbi:hypothetical protein CAPTEDRAFT_201533 [Capitella teleta]|uniref:HAT C-terminal dimerisation domain-containing protein n=1 Tax=Capitella teleta TaxID=283909 RepID=R7UNE7_CAPTE|nr:hypothetical protein CAPTEDRAFT_201533 [Capitella teleta]|eukprot:ELU07598.1 hypothetical protein CAPTEDRAFT_201533 [Capitella teleta]